MPWAEPNVDVNVEQRHARRRRRLPLVANRPISSPSWRRPQYKDRVPRVEEVDGEQTWVFDGHPIGRFSAAGGDRSARPQGELEHGPARVGTRAGPRRRVGPRRPPRGDGRLRDRRAGHLPEHHRPRWPGPRPRRGRALCRLAIEIYNDRMAEIQADVEQPPAPDAAHAGVGHRPLHRGGPARGGPRDARREHDVRPARPRFARPREPRLGPVLGSGQRPPAARCTSTSAPASPR